MAFATFAMAWSSFQLNFENTRSIITLSDWLLEYIDYNGSHIKIFDLSGKPTFGIQPSDNSIELKDVNKILFSVKFKNQGHSATAIKLINISVQTCEEDQYQNCEKWYELSDDDVKSEVERNKRYYVGVGLETNWIYGIDIKNLLPQETSMIKIIYKILDLKLNQSENFIIVCRSRIQNCDVFYP